MTGGNALITHRQQSAVQQRSALLKMRGPVVVSSTKTPHGAGETFNDSGSGKHDAKADPRFHSRTARLQRRQGQVCHLAFRTVAYVTKLSIVYKYNTACSHSLLEL